MTTYGVTPAGFVLKPTTVIADETKADVLSTIRNDIDVSPDQPLGQLIGIHAGKLAEVWELAQVAYNATNRGAAEGVLLDNIGALTGTIREGQQPSTVPCDAKFSLAGTYPPNALVASIVGQPSVQFANVDQIVVPSTGDAGGPIGPSNLYTAQSTLFASLIDGPDAGEALIAADIANGGTPQLTVIVPVTGWASVADVGGVTIGSYEEVDPPFRTRQFQDLSAPGSSTMAAIAAAILEALQNAPEPPALATVQMYENTKLVTDPATGLPGKSYMAVVFDGSDSTKYATDSNLIGDAIVANKPAGMQSFGATSITRNDSQGVARTVYFTRPTNVQAFFAITLAVAPGLTGPQQAAIGALVATAIIAASQGKPFLMYGTTFTPAQGAATTLVPGGEVVAMQFRSIAMGQAGVLDVPDFRLGRSASPTGTGNLDFALSELAYLDSSLVTPSITFTYVGLS